MLLKSNTLQQATNYLVFAALCPLLAACGANKRKDGPQEPGRRAASISIVSGNDQSATVGKPVPAPLVVKVNDEAGQPFPGATVTWSVTVGGVAASMPPPA
jgi:hypothetical protein